jgi:hypothetical protein
VTHVAPEDLTAWVAGEAPDVGADAVEEHVFACDSCAELAKELDALVRRLRIMVPPLLTAERRRALESAATTSIPTLHASPGDEKTLTLGKGREVGFWVLHADIREAEHVDCEMFSLDGTLVASFPDVPFDAERGEIVLGCQTHYRALGLPDDILVRLSTVDSEEKKPVAEYRLNHNFSDM